MRFECLSVESSKVLKVSKRICHLSFPMNSSKVTPCNDDIQKFRSLRSCIMASPDYYGEYKAFLPFFLKQKYLRVWDYVYKAEKVLSSIRSLNLLRYLNMSHSNIEVLPESTTCLVNPQTLKLDYCHRLHTLPKDMRQMKNFRYFGLTHCNSLTRIPKHIGQLTCLKSLSLFIVDAVDGHQLSELKGLNLVGQLCIKGLINLRDLMDAKNANLIGKQDLHSVSLVWQSDSMNRPTQYENVLEGLQPNSNLKKLCISCYRGSKFSTWMKDLLLPNLVEISLENCRSYEHLPPLGKLPYLKVLVLTGKSYCEVSWQ